ncbi:MAG: hypothetical protein LC131_02140, partial [Anaerolineae bacterium]|nr:hypothetical protein [Anaerolineae bacterium]
RGYIRLGLTGVRLKNSSGALAVRNAGDSADANITCADLTLSGKLFGLNSALAGGRLTLSSGVPVMTSDVSNSTSIYYTPYAHDRIPLYDGTTWALYSFSELTNTTTDNTKNPAAVAADSNYDLFVWNDSGTIRLGRGPAWTSGTARGTGAGTTELERVNGILVNKVAITNGPGAQCGTYVGTIRSNGSSQIDCKFGGIAVGGDAGIIGIWNMYNRRIWRAFVGDSTNSWSYTTTTIRPANNSSTMRVSYVAGLADGIIRAAYPFFFTTTGGAPRAGLGHDSTSTFASSQQLGMPSGSGPWPTPNIALTSALGFHYLQALERGNTGVTFYGDVGEPTLSQNGITASGEF